MFNPTTKYEKNEVALPVKAVESAVTLKIVVSWLGNNGMDCLDSDLSLEAYTPIQKKPNRDTSC